MVGLGLSLLDPKLLASSCCPRPATPVLLCTAPAQLSPPLFQPCCCCPAAGEFTHAFTALKTIQAKQGRRGLFAGYGSFLLRDLPFDAIEFVAYEQFKKG